jgi:regulator of CtrA degradation
LALPNFFREKRVNALTNQPTVCHKLDMDAPHYELTPKLLDALYTEAMVLADEARSYFDRDPMAGHVSPQLSVAFSCESLKVTTRLMHSIAWLLNQKALRAGEISELEAGSESRDLGYAPASDDMQTAQFPYEAQTIIQASEDLYYRMQRINMGMRQQKSDQPVPHILRERILQAF